MASKGITANVRVIGKDIVDAKLLMAEPRILEQNRLMVSAMLDQIKPIVVENTPVGPGHFGYHLRDRFETDVRSGGLKTTGVLKSPPTGYWREFGTGGRFRRAGLSARARLGRTSLTPRESKLGGLFGGGGERAFMTAHHAASGVKRLITFYYGGLARWWRS